MNLQNANYNKTKLDCLGFMGKPTNEMALNISEGATDNEMVARMSS